MLIDVNLPRILQARGMREREANALLRALDERVADMPRQDVADALAFALGSISVGNGDYGGERYDAAIAKGVRLVEAEFGHNGTRTGTTVVVGHEIPQTAAVNLVGKPLRTLIDHPLLPGDETIHDVRVGNGETAVDILPRHDAVAVAARATIMDMALEKRVLARHRAKDVRDAGAMTGFTPAIAKRSVTIVAISVITVLLIGWIGGMRDGTLAFFTLSAAASSTLVMVLIAVRMMRREDPGLSERVENMRVDRLIERRRSILERGEE